MLLTAYRHRIAALFAAVGLMLAPFSALTAQDSGTAGAGIGGIIGGGLGQIFGKKGDKTVTTIIGVAVGAFVGSRVAKALSKRDREHLANATQQTVSTGQPQKWTGDKASGRTELVSSDRRKVNMSVAVLDRVTQLPPLDFINTNYIALKQGNILGGPGTQYKPVGALKKNEVVTVTGKVQNAPWYLVSQNGVGTGFVPQSALKATADLPTQTAALQGAVETRQTQVERTCRTVKQTVIVNGKEQSENVTACQTANGWEVA